ncbi:MAG: ornithine carbamoyltransferase [Dehalococcoidia bacterium]|nr:ornithine carbamoyltransferase [Dehalococcoidia bacterium]
MRGRDLISIADLTPEEVKRVIDTAIYMKQRGYRQLLAGQTLALLFEKASLRTHVSFNVAMQQLGGQTVYLGQSEVGLGTREPVADVARVLSRYVDAIAARTYTQQTIVDLATYASVPVINALSDEEHPCQALADLLTIYESKGDFRGLTLAFIGDGNNVASSLAQASAMMGMNFIMASPEGYELPEHVLRQAQRWAGRNGASVEIVRRPSEAVRKADVVYTDVWISMGQEDSYQARMQAFADYQVNRELLAHAPAEAIVMHDLPAHRGEEIVDEVIEGEQSVVFHQAENRLHAQRALLALLLADEYGPVAGTDKASE